MYVCKYVCLFSCLREDGGASLPLPPPPPPPPLQSVSSSLASLPTTLTALHQLCAKGGGPVPETIAST